MNKYTYSLLLGLLTGIISGIETNVVILQNARTISTPSSTCPILEHILKGLYVILYRYLHHSYFKNRILILRYIFDLLKI